jgi:hypothetical protein
MDTSPEAMEKLFIQLSSFKLLTTTEINQLVFQYINKKRPTDSVRMLNKDYRTIEYDNIEQYKNHIDNLKMTHQFFKNLFHFMNSLIEGVKIFYLTPCNKQTWVRFNKDLLSSGVNHNMQTYNPAEYVYYSYYTLKLYRVSLYVMIKGINYIYSDECKNKKIRKLPNYHKGRQYFITSIEAGLVMINELLMMNGFVIKNPDLYVKSNPDSIKITRKSAETIISHYNHLITIDPLYKTRIDSHSPEIYKEKVKLINYNMYASILSYMIPCNFNILCNNLYNYSTLLKINVYMHNLKTNVPNPQYLGDTLNVSIEIE